MTATPDATTTPQPGTWHDRGHIFIVSGDLSRLACDDVLIPTDAEGLCQPWLPTETDPFGAVANNIAALFAATGAGCALYLALQRWRAPQPVPTAEPVDCAAAASVCVRHPRPHRCGWDDPLCAW